MIGKFGIDVVVLSHQYCIFAKDTVYQIIDNFCVFYFIDSIISILINSPIKTRLARHKIEIFEKKIERIISFHMLTKRFFLR